MILEKLTSPVLRENNQGYKTRTIIFDFFITLIAPPCKDSLWRPNLFFFKNWLSHYFTLIFHTIMDYFFVGFQTSLRFNLLITLTTGILSTLMDNVWMFWIIFIKANMLQKKKPWLHTTTLWASSSHTRVSLESFSSTSVRPFPSQKVTMRTALRAYKFLLV